MATVLRNILTSLHGRLLGLANDGSLIVRGEPDQVSITPAASTANVCLVTIQAKNNEGENYAAILNMTVWLSDAATGAGLTGTTASGAVAAGASGVDLSALVSKKALSVQTNTSGVYILSITDTSKTAFYVCAKLEAGRKVAPQTKLLATANYG